MGRTSKLNDELTKKICKYISQGNTYERACTLVGITERSFYNWKKAGEEAKSGKYFQFFQAIKKADAKFLAFHVSNITKHSLKNWQASAWLLERKCAKEFGRTIDLTSGNKPLESFTIKITDPDSGEEIEL